MSGMSQGRPIRPRTTTLDREKELNLIIDYRIPDRNEASDTRLDFFCGDFQTENRIREIRLLRIAIAMKRIEPF